MTKINERAFEACEKLMITFPEKLTYIGKLAFYNCEKLSSEVNLPHLTYLGESAFKFTNITKVNLPNITTLSKEAFSNCTKLKQALLPKLVTIGEEAFWASGLEEFTIPNTCTTINAGAFTYCRKMKNVTVEASTPPVMQQKDGGYAFEGYNTHITIKVPAGTAATYKNATGWKEYAWAIKE